MPHKVRHAIRVYARVPLPAAAPRAAAVHCRLRHPDTWQNTRKPPRKLTHFLVHAACGWLGAMLSAVAAARSPVTGARERLYADALKLFLFLLNGLYLALIAVGASASTLGVGAPAGGGAPTAFFTIWMHWALAAAVAAVLAGDALALGRQCTGARAAPSRSATLLRYAVLALANEVLWELVLAAGVTPAWRLTYDHGRSRLVYPLRYATWACCNAYLVAAVAAAMRVDEHSSLLAVVTTVLSMMTAVPIELAALYSPLWWAMIAAGYILFVWGFAIIAAGVVATHALARSRAQAWALAVFSAAVLASWLSVPVMFHIAQTCAGEGPAGSWCMSGAAEAVWWRRVEGLGKSLFFAVIALAAVIISKADPAPKPLRSSPVAVAGSAKPRGGFSSPWSALLREHAVLLLGLPTAAGYAAYAALREFRRVLPVQGGAEAHVEAAAAVLIALVASGALIAALEAALRQASDRSLISEMLPADYSTLALRAGAFDSSVVWQDEPFVTVLFVDMVGFTKAMGQSARPEAALATMAHVFRHFDALHAAASAVKIETAGQWGALLLARRNAAQRRRLLPTSRHSCPPLLAAPLRLLLPRRRIHELRGRAKRAGPAPRRGRRRDPARHEPVGAGDHRRRPRPGHHRRRRRVLVARRHARDRARGRALRPRPRRRPRRQAAALGPVRLHAHSRQPHGEPRRAVARARQRRVCARPRRPPPALRHHQGLARRGRQGRRRLRHVLGDP